MFQLVPRKLQDGRSSTLWASKRLWLCNEELQRVHSVEEKCVGVSVSIIFYLANLDFILLLSKNLWIIVVIENIVFRSKIQMHNNKLTYFVVISWNILHFDSSPADLDHVMWPGSDSWLKFSMTIWSGHYRFHYLVTMHKQLAPPHIYNQIILPESAISHDFRAWSRSAGDRLKCNTF